MKTWAVSLLMSATLITALRAAPPTAAQIVERLEAHFQAVTDYTCVMESETKGEKDSQRGTYRLWFRQPDLIRIKVERGKHRGSEVSVTRKGNVRAHGGGLVKPFVITMKKTDPRLKEPRGSYAWESDFGSYLRRLREKLARAQEAEVQPVPDAADQVAIRFSYRDPERQKSLREVWTVDTVHWLLLKTEVYEDEKEVEHVEFRDYRENTGLKESFFDL